MIEVIIIAIFGIFNLLAFRMGYMAGKAQETLVVNKELPAPVDLSENYIDEEWVEKDAS